MSSPPLSGSYQVRCVDKNGAVSITNDIKFDLDSRWATHRIMTECAGLNDKLEWL